MSSFWGQRHSQSLRPRLTSQRPLLNTHQAQEVPLHTEQLTHPPQDLTHTFFHFPYITSYDKKPKHTYIFRARVSVMKEQSDLETEIESYSDRYRHPTSHPPLTNHLPNPNSRPPYTGTGNGNGNGQISATELHLNPGNLPPVLWRKYFEDEGGKRGGGEWGGGESVWSYLSRFCVCGSMGEEGILCAVRATTFAFGSSALVRGSDGLYPIASPVLVWGAA